MYCGNCGLPLKDDETICPSCNTPTGNVIEAKIIDDTNDSSSSKYEAYKETEKISEQYGFNKLLIYSILELLCCSRLFGIIALIMLLTQLKSAIDQRKFDDADKAKKNVKTILIIGLILGIIINVGNVVLQAIITIAELSY